MPSFTRRAIIESFLKLLNERPLNQITVKDIVEDCGINRNSFYYHFADIPTMVTEIVTERADSIIAQFGEAATLEDCMGAMVHFAVDSKRAIYHMYRSASRDEVERNLMQLCRHVVESYAKAMIGTTDISDGDKEILISFFQCELFGQVVAWLNSNMSYDLEERFTRLCQLMHGLTAYLIQKCAEDENG